MVRATLDLMYTCRSITVAPAVSASACAPSATNVGTQPCAGWVHSLGLICKDKSGTMPRGGGGGAMLFPRAASPDDEFAY